MAKSKKTETDKNLEAGLGDLAKLVLGKLDEHGVTMEQALSAIGCSCEAKKKLQKPLQKKPRQKKLNPRVQQS